VDSAGHPTDRKRVEVPVVAIIQFESDKIAHEHLYRAHWLFDDDDTAAAAVCVVNN
jgi:hypothetical protein